MNEAIHVQTYIRNALSFESGKVFWLDGFRRFFQNKYFKLFKVRAEVVLIT